MSKIYRPAKNPWTGPKSFLHINREHLAQKHGFISRKITVVTEKEKATEIESIDFVGCYKTRLKDNIYAVTHLTVEISMHM